MFAALILIAILRISSINYHCQSSQSDLVVLVTVMPVTTLALPVASAAITVIKPRNHSESASKWHEARVIDDERTMMKKLFNNCTERYISLSYTRGTCRNLLDVTSLITWHPHSHYQTVY